MQSYRFVSRFNGHNISYKGNGGEVQKKSTWWNQRISAHMRNVRTMWCTARTALTFPSYTVSLCCHLG